MSQKVKDLIVRITFSPATALLSPDTFPNMKPKCFGYNKNGELGVGDTINRGDGNGGMGDELPDVDLGTGAVATAVSAGWQHTCALLEGGNVECWGERGGRRKGAGVLASSWSQSGPAGRGRGKRH